MNTAKRARSQVANAWAAHAEALADWALARIVVRRDVFGAYYKADEEFRQTTAHEPLTREILIAHFRGERVIGCHSTSADGLCKALAWDIDAHDETADPVLNWHYAWWLAEECKKLGLRPLIFDSNGKGGYHVRVFFKKPVPVAVAHWLGVRLVAGSKEHGFATPPEFFPKQAAITITCPFGNWLRLPGRHHKRSHYTRIFDPEGDAWLEGEAAVLRLLKVAGDDPATVLKLYREEEQARAEADGVADKVGGNGTRTRTQWDRRDKPTEDVVREALGFLPDAWADPYDPWLAVGMALNDWDPVRGRALWDHFSKRSDKHDAAVLDEKWSSFHAGGGLTVGTIFREAMDRGWEPPWKSGTRRGPSGGVNGQHKPGGTGHPPSAAAADEGMARGEGLPPDPARLRLRTRTGRQAGLDCVEYLYEPFLPLGMLTLVAGLGGMGKSQLLLDIAAAVTRGRPILNLPEDAALKPCDVLILAAEDVVRSMANPRLIASGADVDRYEFVDGIEDADGRLTPFDLNYVPILRQHIVDGRAAGKDYRLVVIDPLATYVGRARIDDHRDAELKPALELLSRLAEEFDLAILGNAHLNKSNGKIAAHRVMGGGAYVTTSRVVYLYGQHPTDPEARGLVISKFNTPLKPPPVLVRREPIPHEESLAIIAAHEEMLPALDRERKRHKLAGQLSRLRYEGAADGLTAEAILDGPAAERKPKRCDKAEEFLREFLAGGLARPSLEVFAAAKRKGISRDACFEAKDTLHIVPQKDGHGGWSWSLPVSESSAGIDEETHPF